MTPMMSQPFTTLFFDLDDTLYPSNSGVWAVIRERITTYMIERLGFSPAEVDETRRNYFATHGTTLRGLMVNHPDQMTPAAIEDFLAYVHDAPIGNYLQPAPALRELLLSLPQPRWILTNADDAHAGRVMEALGVTGCFQGVIDIKALGFACKPTPEAYQKALALTGNPPPERCVFFDDSRRNLAAARSLGFFTVWVGSAESDPAACLSVASLEELPQAMPELWR